MPAVSLAVFQLEPLKFGKIGDVKSIFDPKEAFCEIDRNKQAQHEIAG